MSSLNVSNRVPLAQLPPQVAPSQVIYSSNVLRTYEGAPAVDVPVEFQLRRAVCSCLLWENTFYESGQDIGARIVDLVGKVPVATTTRLAVDARSHFNLRHVPLLVMAAVAAPGRGGSRLIGDALADVIQRPDELTEFLAIYARTYGVQPNAIKRHLSAQVKKGLAAAFAKFDEYQLAKYFSPGAEAGAPVKARDVMFLSHPKPTGEAQAAIWKRLADKEAIKEGGADTWETELMKGANKRETFERLIRDQKLGYLALLRNLRNMVQVDVDHVLISCAILARKGARRVLPFRYVAAARACPEMTGSLDVALRSAVGDMDPLPGSTVVLVDVSGSMGAKLSGKSDLDRIDAAATLAAVIPGDCQVLTFSDFVVLVGQARGLTGIEAIKCSQPHSSTHLGKAVDFVNQQSGVARLIVITDEQFSDHVPQPTAERAYMINVASYRNGVGYGGRWTHIDGFSEQVIRFIAEFEKVVA